jgi:uncharacterized protein YkwD
LTVRVLNPFRVAADLLSGRTSFDPVRDRAEMEVRIFNLTNDVRKQHGFGVLALALDCRQVAFEHSKDMVERRFFDHINPDGLGPQDRASRAGLHWSVGENLSMFSCSAGARFVKSSSREASLEFLDGWMKSAGHRANILNPVYTHLGVGVHVSFNSVYATQLFAVQPLHR